MVPQRRTPSARLASLALALLAASAGVFAQEELDRASTAPQRAIVERIKRVQAQDGPRSADLIAPFTALGLLYQESGDLALATVAVERAFDLVRMNYGVQSLDQAPLLRQRMALAEQRNDPAAAWNLEQALLALARRHDDDPQTVAILHEIGDRRMDVLERYFNGEYPSEIVFGCYYSNDRAEAVAAIDPARVGPAMPFGDCTAGSRTTVIRSLLWESQMHYSDAIKVGLGNDLYGNSELRELEMDIVRSSFEFGAVFEGGRDYALGRESLRRIAAYEAATDAPPLAQIEALVAIADWDLIFSTNRKLQAFALENYERAYRRLQTSDLPDAVVAAWFAPATPVVLPTFLPSPFVTDGAAEPGSFVDVSFEVTKEGRAQNIKIVAKNAQRADERLVRQAILRGRYRPRLVHGRFADAAPVAGRYRLTQPASAAEEGS